MTVIDLPAFPTGLDIWYTVCPSASGSNLAINRGEIERAFAGTGASVTSIRTHEDRKVREAHYNQDHHHLFREGGNIPPIWARSAGRDIRLLGLAWLEHHSTIITLPNRGIEGPADLKGKRLGLVRRPNDPVDYPRATALHAYLAVLESVGLDGDDVKFVDIDLVRSLVGTPPASTHLSASAFSVEALRSPHGPLISALVTGEIDALHVELHNAAIQDILGAHVVFDLARDLDEVGRVSSATPIAFTVRSDLLDEHPDAVTHYVAQSLRSARWARTHQDEARRWIARDLALPEEEVTRVYSPGIYDALEQSLDPHLVDLITVQKDFLFAQGFIPEDFDVEEWIAPEPLAAATAIVDAEEA